jgi:hypothetical protein
MYACICETGSGFSRGCALPVIANSFLATHPPMLKEKTGALLKRLRPDEEMRR